MIIERLDARYMHLRNAELTVLTYGDRTTALVAIQEDEDGMPDNNALTVNLSAYDMKPSDKEYVYIPDYGEHEGVGLALKELGIVEIVKSVHFGPYGHGSLAKIIHPELVADLKAGV